MARGYGALAWHHCACKDSQIQWRVMGYRSWYWVDGAGGCMVDAAAAGIRSSGCACTRFRNRCGGVCAVCIARSTPQRTTIASCQYGNGE